MPQISVGLSEAQGKKLLKAINDKTPLSIQIKGGNMTGDTSIYLPDRLEDKYYAAKNKNRGMVIKYTPDDLAMMTDIAGEGFLSSLIKPLKAVSKTGIKALVSNTAKDLEAMGKSAEGGCAGDVMCEACMGTGYKKKVADAGIDNSGGALGPPMILNPNMPL